MKVLYRYTVNKSEQEEVRTENEDKTVTLSFKEKLVPVTIALKRPSRREIEDIDLYYTVKLSELQVQGVATNLMILNSYQDGGGVDSKKEIPLLRDASEKLDIKRNEYLKKVALGEEDKELYNEILELVANLESYQQKLRGIFSRSAETLAEQKTILWQVLNFTFVEVSPDKFEPLFRGNSFETKLDFYYSIFDQEDKYKFEKEAFNKAVIFIDAWFRKRVETEDQFKLLESYIDAENGRELENSDYLAESPQS